MARWPKPAIIWLRQARKNRYWRNRRQASARGWRIPWTSALLYGLTLALAGGVLWKVPARPDIAPVEAPVSHASQPSWMDRTLTSMREPGPTFQAWLNQGMPIMGLTLNPHNFSVHLKGLALTAIRSITGVQLDSLGGLLKMEIPQLALVSAPPPLPSSAQPVVTHPKTKSPRTKAQDAVDPALPGDGGRVWAQLGENPEVGIYQTHSHESFWAYVPAGSTTAYSTQWSKTIVQVGWWLAQDLQSHGVSVVQSRVDNMSEGVLASYNKSYYTAKDLMKWYPSVHMLMDLHRATQDVPAADIHGQKVAKILIVVGTNKLLPNEYWHQNLEVALKLAKALGQLAPGILQGQGIDTVPYRYNQQLMPADLMIEVGGPNSTLSEERYAVNDLAEAVSELIRSGVIPKAP